MINNKIINNIIGYLAVAYKLTDTELVNLTYELNRDSDGHVDRIEYCVTKYKAGIFERITIDDILWWDSTREGFNYWDTIDHRGRHTSKKHIMIEYNLWKYENNKD